MSFNVLEEAVARTMRSIENLEGIIVISRIDGSVIVGQTIFELEHENIAKEALELVTRASKLGIAVEKGGNEEVFVGLQEGFVVVVGTGNTILAGIASADAKPERGMITIKLRKLAEKLDALLRAKAA